MLRIVTKKRLQHLEEDVQTYREIATRMLASVRYLLEQYGNKLPSSSWEVSYMVEHRLFEFMEHPSLFKCFYVDKVPVSPANFINLLYETIYRKGKNDA